MKSHKVQLEVMHSSKQSDLERDFEVFSGFLGFLEFSRFSRVFSVLSSFLGFLRFSWFSRVFSVFLSFLGFVEFSLFCRVFSVISSAQSKKLRLCGVFECGRASFRVSGRDWSGEFTIYFLNWLVCDKQNRLQ